ncbi:hypothetical protein [Leptodesmis sp.]|uniref:hypothetical protein n=1 Tax=Leptodesmis sp. TaxID=3100501 RepID=UPI00405348A8
MVHQKYFPYFLEGLFTVRCLIHQVELYYLHGMQMSEFLAGRSRKTSDVAVNENPVIEVTVE